MTKTGLAPSAVAVRRSTRALVLSFGWPVAGWAQLP